MRLDQRPRLGRPRELWQRGRPRLSGGVRGPNRSLTASAGWSLVLASHRTSWTSHPLIRSEVIRGSPGRQPRRNTAPNGRGCYGAGTDTCSLALATSIMQTAQTRSGRNRESRTLAIVLSAAPRSPFLWRWSSHARPSSPPGSSCPTPVAPPPAGSLLLSCLQRPGSRLAPVAGKGGVRRRISDRPIR